MCKEIIGGKALFLPEVNAAVREEAVEPLRGEYPCPCCGEVTLPVPQEDAVAFICPVCMWENDVFIRSEDEPSDENHGMTLREGRENYRAYGMCRMK